MATDPPIDDLAVAIGSEDSSFLARFGPQPPHPLVVRETFEDGAGVGPQGKPVALPKSALPKLKGSRPEQLPVRFQYVQKVSLFQEKGGLGTWNVKIVQKRPFHALLPVWVQFPFQPTAHGCCTSARLERGPAALTDYLRRMKSILINVSGQDNPGITAELMGILGKGQARMLDVQQTVVGRVLGLSIQVCLDEQTQPLLKDLLFKAHELGVHLDFQTLNESEPAAAESRKRYALTLLASELKPSALHQVTSVLAKQGWNIDTITSLGDRPVSCLELILSAPPESFSAVEAELVALSGRLGVDIALQEEGLLRRSKRLVVLDMDSTLIQQEIIDELADLHGVKDRVAEITHRAMNGELDFEQSLRARVSLLKGAPDTVFRDVRERIELTEGAARFCKVLKRLGYRLAVISGGFVRVVEPIARELGLDYHFANRLEVVNGKLTGGLVGPIVGPQRKADLVESLAQQEGIEMSQVIAIGDGANDLPMLALAGLGIAFNAKPAVQKEASTAINQRSLLSVLHLLGIRGQELLDLEEQLPSLV